MNTSKIIEKCFKKAGMNTIKDDKAKYLFQLLCDETYKEFEKKKSKVIEDELAQILGEGYSLEIGSNRIISASNSINSFEDKEFVVENRHGKERGYKTLKSAMNFAEKD